MSIIKLRIYKGFDRENRSGCNFTSSVVVHDQIPSKFQICYPLRIKIANRKIMKICSRTKIRVLSVNLESEISYNGS